MVSKDYIEIRIHGRGGQGAWTASRILAEAALLADKYAQSFPEFGPERSGAPVTSYARIGNSRIDIHSGIYDADVVIVLDPTLVSDAARDFNDGAIFVLPTLESAKEVLKLVGDRNVRVWGVDAVKISVEAFGRGITNTTMLGAFVKATNGKYVSLDNILEGTKRVLGERLGESLIEKNFIAIKRAFNECKEMT